MSFDTAREFSQDEAQAVPQAQGSVSLAEMNQLLEEWHKLELLGEELAAQQKEINKKIATINGKVTAAMKEQGMEKYSSPVGDVKIVQRWSVNNPAGDEAKTELFNWLREQGIFEAYATVNNNSLNALWKKEFQLAQERGDLGWTMPGVGAPKLFESLKPTFKKF